MLSSGEELFFGIVAPVGVEYSIGIDVLKESLAAVGYDFQLIRLSDLIQKFAPLVKRPRSEMGRIRHLMNAGNDLRRESADNSIVARAAIAAVRAIREAKTGDADQPCSRTAYVFQSLKNPGETKMFRDVYGVSFLCLSFYQPRELRVTQLASRIAASSSNSNSTSFRSYAEKLVKLDEDDEADFGQSVSQIFADADYFIDLADREKTRSGLTRFIQSIFGYPFHTPLRDEFGMFQAWSVSLRSADLSRQVGAAVLDKEGNLVAVGCNDVPAPGGGLYWPEDGDQRDFQLGFDSSSKMRKELVLEFYNRLKKHGWIAPEFSPFTNEQIAEKLLDSTVDQNAVLKGAAVTGLLEFGRMIHAEMAAISDAARRGIGLSGGTLYTTTFPCHVCARHIVACGIVRVVYIEPYPKSRAKELHSDSISIDSPNISSKQVQFVSFSGVAPIRYDKIYVMRTRKDKRGVAIKWNAAGASPVFVRPAVHYLVEEQNSIKTLPILENTSEP